VLLLLNAHHEAIPFVLPETKAAQPWELLLDTAHPQGEPLQYTGGQQYELQGRSMVLLQVRAPQELASPLLATAAAAERAAVPQPEEK
jgi:glycogen operon protein